MFGLDPDISLMDPRNTLRLSEDDGRKNNTVIPVLLFFPVVPVPSISFVIPRLDRGICKGDVRLKAEYDKEKMRPNMTRATPRMTILHLLFPRVSRFLLSLNRSRAGLHRSRLTALPELLPTLRQV